MRLIVPFEEPSWCYIFIVGAFLRFNCQFSYEDFYMRSPPEVSTPPGNSLTVAAKSSTEQAVKGPLSMSTVFTKLGGRGF